MPEQADEGDVRSRLFKAIEAGSVETVRELLELDSRLATSRNAEGASALIWAAYYRQEAITELLLSKGLKPDIFEASTLGLTDRTKELLQADRSLVERYSFDGWTPLHLAAHFGRADVIRALLAQGADHRAIARNSNANPPLQAAAAGRQAEAVRLLLQAGAEVDAPSHSGFTALHSAAASGDVETVRILLKAGARADPLTDGGKTPLDYAIEADHAEIVDLLEAAGTPET